MEAAKVDERCESVFESIRPSYGKLAATVENCAIISISLVMVRTLGYV